MNILSRLAGSAAQRLGDDMRQERTLRNDARRTMGIDRHRSQLRMGEMSLGQFLQQKSPLYRQQVAGAKLGNQQTQQAIESAPAALAVDQQNAATRALGASVDERNASLRETEQTHREKVYNDSQTKPVEDREGEWLTWMSNNPKATPEQALAEARRLRLNTTDHNTYKDWFNTEIKPRAGKKADGGAESQPATDPLDRLGAPMEASTPPEDRVPRPHRFVVRPSPGMGAPVAGAPASPAPAMRQTVGAAAAQATPDTTARLNAIRQRLAQSGKSPTEIDTILGRYRR